MAVVASDRLTLATLPSPSYVRTFYLKQSSTLNPPGVPEANPPGGNWSTTEPTFSPNETATVYTVMLTAYGTVSFDYGPVQKSSSFEAAKQAYNQAISAGNSASDAYQKALDAQNDLANLQIGGKNLALNSKAGWESTGYGVTGAQKMSEPWIVGETYTVTVKGEVNEGQTFRVWRDSGWMQFGSLTHIGNGIHRVTATAGETTRDNKDEWAVYNYPSAGAEYAHIEWVKIERGSKGTDWTPAPEDVDADIVAVGDKAKADLDALEIGGRNLIRNSVRNTTSSGNIVDSMLLGERPPLAGETVTISIKGELGADRTHFQVYNSGSWIDLYPRIFPSDQGPDGVYRVSLNWRTELDSGTVADNTSIRIYQAPVSGVSESTIEWVKLERGTKSTDWSPAPEDVDSDLSFLAGEVSQKASIHYGRSEPSDKNALWVKDGVPHIYVDYGEEAYTWVNRAQGLANWTGEFEYSDGVIYLSGYSASARMPNVETGGASTFRQAVLYKSAGYAETRPGDARIYRMSTYHDADGNPVQNGAGYSGNGNASGVVGGTWTWNTWLMDGGPQVQSVAVTTSLSPSWTGDQAYIAGVHVYTQDDPTPGVLFDGNTPGFKWDGEPNASTSSYAGPGWYPVRDQDAAGAVALVQKGVSEAQAKADEALAGLATRPTKSYVDDQIILSANGKNSITTSLNAPSGAGVENGDLWRRHDSAGHVYQEFTWRDGEWRATRVTSEMVTNMDIHKLTVSGDASFTSLVADEIWSGVVKTELAVATELIAGDAIINNTLEADKLVAKTIKADSGVIDDLAIIEAHIGNASVTNAKIKDIDAGKITAGFIDAARLESRTIAAEKLLLGSFDNFFHDPRFEDERGYSPGVVVGETLRINAGQTVNVSWLAMPVDKDESYTVGFRKTGSGNLTFAIHSATSPSGPYSLVGDSFNTATEEGDFEFTVTADKPYIRWVASNTTAQSFISEIKIRKVFTGIRLEDGIITTEKIQADSIVSDLIQADAIHSEHMGANSVRASSIGAGQITGNHIDAGTITGQHIESGTIKTGNIEAGAITAEELHLGAVTYDKIALGAVRGDNLSDITKDQFMNAIDGDLSNIIDSAETIADSIIITPGEIRLTTETTTGDDGVARNYLSLPASYTNGMMYDRHFSFNSSQGSQITVSITLRADKPNSRFNFDLGYQGMGLRVISNTLVPTEWTTITGTVVAPSTTYYYIDAFMFNLSSGTQRTAAIDIAELRIQGAIPNGNFDNGDLHWNLPANAEIKSLGTTTNETALSLTSTRQTFIVDGKDVVYIDSEEESMNIRNVVVDDSIRVGNHIIEKISDDITAFMWAGDR